MPTQFATLLILASAASASSTVVKLDIKRLARLTLPVMGSEHLLALAKLDDGNADDSLLLTQLLSYDQGSLLESALCASAATNKIALAAQIFGRRDVFEAVSGGMPVSPWSCPALAQKGDNLGAVMLAHLAEYGWTPTHCTLGAIGSGASSGAPSLTMRDLGAFTEPSPTAVRLDTAGQAVLVCQQQQQQPPPAVTTTLSIPLESVAEAVLLARALPESSSLPIWISSTAWEQRAVAPSRLPELDAVLWEQ